jgi:hypothetical protein
MVSPMAELMVEWLAVLRVALKVVKKAVSMAVKWE